MAFVFRQLRYAARVLSSFELCMNTTFDSGSKTTMLRVRLLAAFATTALSLFGACGGETSTASARASVADATGETHDDAHLSDGGDATAPVDVTDADAAGDACAPGTYPFEGTGPWDTAKSCWPSTKVFFGCFGELDGTTLGSCFVRISTGEFFLTKTGIPSSGDFRQCYEPELASHEAVEVCE